MSKSRRANVLIRAFRALMPHDERFIERFSEHSQLIVPAAEAFRALMSGDGLAEQHAAEISRLEDEAAETRRRAGPGGPARRIEQDAPLPHKEPHRMFRTALIACLMLASPVFAQNRPGPTLSNVLKKGSVDCAVAIGTPGFSTLDSKGEFRGLDTDTCRAIAAAIFGDAAKARMVPTNGAQRLPSLQSGQVDLVVETLTQTQTREAANGLMFAGVNFYDGQSFLVRKSMGVKNAKDLDGASVCVTSGSTSELNLADWSRANNVQVNPVIFERTDEGREAYNAGRCDAYSTDSSQLAAIATIMRDPDNQMVLPDIISKEPLGPAVRQGDDQWFEIVKWTLAALIEAEEQGITQANVDEKLKSEAPQTKRLLGVVGDYGLFMALDNKWAYNAIKAVGNYGEMFERNLGQGSPMKLPRGRNDLWMRGGLMYAPPIR